MAPLSMGVDRVWMIVINQLELGIFQKQHFCGWKYLGIFLTTSKAETFESMNTPLAVSHTKKPPSIIHDFR